MDTVSLMSVPPRPERTTWGARIRTFRRHRMLKQQALAAMLGVDQASVSRWERDIGTPPERIQCALRAFVRTVKAPDQALKFSVVSSLSHVMLADKRQRILLASSPYCVGQGVSREAIVGMSTLPQVTEVAQRIWEETTELGFYRGEVAAVEVVARANTLGGLKDLPLHAVWTPVFLSDGTVLKRVERRVLSEEEFSASPLACRPVVTMMSDIFST